MAQKRDMQTVSAQATTHQQSHIAGLQSSHDRSQRSVFVGNIPYEAGEEQLKEIFNQAGPVVSFRIVYDRETGKPKGYGFCEYQDTETAQSAMRNLNNYDFHGRPLRVGVAAGEQSKDDRSMQQAIGGPLIESPFGEPVEPEKAPEAISKAVASLPPEQMFELMKQMKMCIQNNPNEARNMLLQNPQLAYALLQAQIVMKIVDPHVALAMLHRQTEQIPPLVPTSGASGDTARPGPKPLEGLGGSSSMAARDRDIPPPPPPASRPGPPPSSMGGPPSSMGSGGPVMSMGPTSTGPGPRPPFGMGGPPNAGARDPRDPNITNMHHILGLDQGPPRGPAPGPPQAGRPGGLLGDRPPRPPGNFNDGPPRLGGPPGGFEPGRGGPGGFSEPRMSGPPRGAAPAPLGGGGPFGQDRDMRGGPPPPPPPSQNAPPRGLGPGPGGIGGPPGAPTRGPAPPGGARDPRAERDPRSQRGPPMSIGPGGPPQRAPPQQAGGMGGLGSALSGLGGGGGGPGQDQEKAALIMQVLQLSDEQISMLPPDQRQSILILKEQIARSSNN